MRQQIKSEQFDVKTKRRKFWRIMVWTYNSYLIRESRALTQILQSMDKWPMSIHQRQRICKPPEMQ